MHLCRTAPLLILGLALAADAASPGGVDEALLGQKWFELRSEGFHVYSCAPTQFVLEASRRLEQFRRAYGDLAGWSAVTMPPIVVMIYPGMDSMHRFGHLDRPGGTPATSYSGIFYGGPLQDLIALAPTRDDTNTMQTVFHEYTHVLLRHNAAVWPPWLTEGMAEIYATMEMETQQIRLGRPRVERVAQLAERPLLPLSELFAIRHDSPDYRGSEKTGVFYGESWLLTHYLMLGGHSYYQSRFPLLTTLLRQGQNPYEAFTNTFTTHLPVLEKQLAQYLAEGRFGTLTKPVKTDLWHLPPPASRTLSPAEVCYRLGRQLLQVDRENDAAAWFAQTRARAPKGILSLQGEGLLAAHQKRWDAALHALDEATRRAGGDHVLHFVLGQARYHVASPEAGESYEPVPRERAAEIRAAFQKSMELMPSFGPAHYWLGLLEMIQAEDLAKAEQQFQTALQLQPQQPFFRLPLAQTQMRRRNAAGARQTLAPLLRPDTPPPLREAAEQLLSRLNR